MSSLLVAHRQSRMGVSAVTAVILLVLATYKKGRWRGGRPYEDGLRDARAGAPRREAARRATAEQQEAESEEAAAESKENEEACRMNETIVKFLLNKQADITLSQIYEKRSLRHLGSKEQAQILQTALTGNPRIENYVSEAQQLVATAEIEVEKAMENGKLRPDQRLECIEHYFSQATTMAKLATALGSKTDFSKSIQAIKLLMVYEYLKLGGTKGLWRLNTNLDLMRLAKAAVPELHTLFSNKTPAEIDSTVFVKFPELLALDKLQYQQIIAEANEANVSEDQKQRIKNGLDAIPTAPLYRKFLLRPPVSKRRPRIVRTFKHPGNVPPQETQTHKPAEEENPKNEDI
jgi:hypothetical protein